MNLRKKMKAFTLTIWLIISLNCVPSSVFAQRNKEVQALIEEGKEYFNQQQYFKSGEFFKHVIGIQPENQTGLFYLGECQRQLFFYDNAIQYYQKLYQFDSLAYPLTRYYYPLMQKYLGDYDKAAAGFDEFIQYALYTDEALMPNKDNWIEQAFMEKEGCFFAIKEKLFLQDSIVITHLPFPVNSEFNDFAPNFIDNDSSMVFSSGRFFSGDFSVDNRFGEAFTNNFRYKKGRHKWNYIKNKDKFTTVNSRWNDGAGVFNDNLDRFYFTRCGSENDLNCKILVSEKVNGVWQAAKILNENVNMPGFESKQPAINRRADTLYFVSNRPGGIGKNDLWRSIKQNGDWQMPVNMGDKINTVHDEISPYYHNPTNSLFFSSLGHQSLGGFDIYLVPNTSSTSPKIINLGSRVNSNADDCYFVMGEKRAYFSSNRAKGLGKFDIYSFDLSELSLDNYNDIFSSGREWLMKPTVSSQNFAELYAIREEDYLYYESIQPSKKSEIDAGIANRLGVNEMLANNFNGESEKEYFESLPEAYKKEIERLKVKQIQGTNSEIFDANSTQVLAKISNITDAKEDKVNIKGRLASDRLELNKADLSVAIVNAEGEVIATTKTNSDGSFEFVEVTGTSPYKIVLTSLKEKVSGFNSFEIEDLSVFNPDAITTFVAFENIYFPFDGALVPKNANVILDELANYLNADPNLKLELFASTDTVGLASYNDGLSKKRGLNVIAYLKTKKVNQERLVLRPIGENFKEILSDKPSELNEQYSRRVAFSLSNGNRSFQSKFQTVFTKTQVDLKTLAKASNLEEKQLLRMNGFMEGEKIPAFSPITIIRDREIDESIFYRLKIAKHYQQ